MLIKTGGGAAVPEQQTTQKTIEVTIEPPPKDWAVEILSGIVVAVVVAGILAMWRKRK
jgi:hypothetical protein